MIVKVLKEIILLILFATPLGYLLGLLKLIQVNPGNAVSIQMVGNQPLNVIVDQNSLFTNRLRWSIHGVLLMFQALVSLVLINHVNKYDAKPLGAYLWLTFLLGITTFISGIFPNFPWNRRPFGISIFEILFFVSLFTFVGALILKTY